MSAINDRDLDRLVDGELTESQRQDLLRLCDTEPDAWRRCALAFLEAQTWRESLLPVASGAGPVPEREPRSTAPHSALRIVRPWLAIAATLFLAFALGRVTGSGETVRPVAMPTAPEAPVSPPRDPSPMPEPAGPSQDTGELLTALDTDSGKVPTALKSGDEFSLDETTLKEWERQGYLVERRQRVVDVDPGDGRRVRMPVEEVKLRYVGNWTF